MKTFGRFLTLGVSSRLPNRVTPRTDWDDAAPSNGNPKLDVTSTVPVARGPTADGYPGAWNELESRAVDLSAPDVDPSARCHPAVEEDVLGPLRRGDFGRATAGAWSLVERWLVADEGGGNEPVPAEGLTALNRVAAMLYLTGDHVQAHKLWEQIVALCRRRPDLAPLEQAAAFHGIGTVLHKAGNLVGADRLLRKAWEVRRKLLGEFAPDTAASLNRLGLVRREAGDLEEAEALLRRTLEVRHRILGELHPDFALSLNNLGAVLMARGKAKEAKRYIERAVEVRRQILGEAHPDLASSLSNLAVLCQATGESDRAIELQRQALEIRREALGESHPHYITNLNTLAEMLLGQGDLAAALPLLDQTINRSHQGLVNAMAEEDAMFGAAESAEAINGTAYADDHAMMPAEASSPPSEAPDASATEWAASAEAPPVPPRRPRVPAPPPSLRGKLSMSEMIDELSRRIEDLGAEFRALSEPLAGNVKALKEPGAPPSEELLLRLTEGREEFVALREALAEQADAIGLTPADGEVNDLSGLGRLLVRVEAEHRRLEQVRASALEVLDRALALAHIGQPAFGPLQACHEQAQALRELVTQAQGSQVDELAGPVTRDDHPFALLSALVGGPETLDDDAWANAYDAVAQAFGRPLAVAASRSKLLGPKVDVVQI
jgi:tetratricopeptide (TPR) repeat protein